MIPEPTNQTKVSFARKRHAIVRPPMEVMDQQQKTVFRPTVLNKRVSINLLVEITVAVQIVCVH